MFVDKVIKTLKNYETKQNIVWFDFSGREHYNKDIIHAFRYKSILKYMLKILSVRHYKKQDILTELDDTQHNNAQNGTEWQYKNII